MADKIIQRIGKYQYANFGQKRVGIYARVSSHLPSQLQSMAMQISALTQLVYNLPHWQLADIYIDFESGSTNNRYHFQRMIDDSRDKKLDLIITKSVSRFGRDTIDGLNAIRELKAYGIEVYFDLEELKSFQPDFDCNTHFVLQLPRESVKISATTSFCP